MSESLSLSVIRAEVWKRAFASRSEAGRYAANMRWAGQASGRSYIEGIGRVSRNADGEWVDAKGTLLAPSVTRDMRIRDRMERVKQGTEQVFDAEKVINRIASGEQVEIEPQMLGVVLRSMVLRKDHPDITNLTLTGTRLMSRDNLGIPRAEMPQIPTDKKGEFVNLLEQRGVGVSREEVQASTLKPIQAEISGTTSAQIMVRMLTSQEPKNMQDFDGGAIVVSKDNYVIDGHHRWAAHVGLELGGDKGHKMKILKVDLPHEKLIDITKKWNETLGIKGLELGQNNPKDPDMSKARLLKMIDLIVAGE